MGAPQIVQQAYHDWVVALQGLGCFTPTTLIMLLMKPRLHSGDVGPLTLPEISGCLPHF